MDALPNANSVEQPSGGFTPIAFPKAVCSQTGVSVEYIPDPLGLKRWYVFRASYGRSPKAVDYLIRQMVTDAQNPIESLNSQVALSLARSAAIPYGQILNNEEMESIINELFSCSNVNYTPDGKAILCILPQGDIEQLLG